MRSSKKNAAPLTPLLGEIVESMFRLARGLRHAMESGKTQPVNMHQLHALLFLREHGGLTMTELAKQLCVTSPTATSFVNRLVRQKLVERFADKKNRKLVRVRLTRNGRKALMADLERHHSVVGSVFGLLTVDEQKQLLSLHKKLLSRLADSSLS